MKELSFDVSQFPFNQIKCVCVCVCMCEKPCLPGLQHQQTATTDLYMRSFKREPVVPHTCFMHVCDDFMREPKKWTHDVLSAWEHHREPCSYHI